jgi:hypothetical protein
VGEHRAAAAQDVLRLRGPARLAAMFELIPSARDRWRAVNAPHLIALVRAGATLIDGTLAGGPAEGAEPEAA